MKAECIKVKGQAAMFRIIDRDMPEPLQVYEIKPYKKGSSAQRGAFESLCDAFFLWMLETNSYQFEDHGIQYDFRNPNVYLFREQLKFQYGAGAKFYGYYSDTENRWFYVDDIQDVPDDILLRWRNGEKQLITWKDTISMSTYTKDQYAKIITSLKVIIQLSGCNDKQVEEILKGMGN